MAGAPAKVSALLDSVWQRAKVSADKERVALEEYAAKEAVALEGGIQSWDWRFFAERVRKSKYSFDESVLKPYLSLERVTQAVMEVSGRLYGLKYTHRPDIKAYHPDVKVYEVHEGEKLVAIFLHDNFARPMKASGAWMSELRSQTKNLSPGTAPIEAVPIVLNNNNFSKGSPTLLSFDDAVTLFHEMGHAHHGMLSDCTYSRLASTNVLTDFLELPSQLMEHFLRRPEVLQECVFDL
jgi:peptidyl-dipeptidase Dcp